MSQTDQKQPQGASREVAEADGVRDLAAFEATALPTQADAVGAAEQRAALAALGDFPSLADVTESLRRKIAAATEIPTAFALPPEFADLASIGSAAAIVQSVLGLESAAAEIALESIPGFTGHVYEDRTAARIDELIAASSALPAIPGIEGMAASSILAAISSAEAEAARDLGGFGSAAAAAQTMFGLESLAATIGLTSAGDLNSLYAGTSAAHVNELIAAATAEMIETPTLDEVFAKSVFAGFSAVEPEAARTLLDRVTGGGAKLTLDHLYSDNRVAEWIGLRPSPITSSLDSILPASFRASTQALGEACAAGFRTLDEQTRSLHDAIARQIELAEGIGSIWVTPPESLLEGLKAISIHEIVGSVPSLLVVPSEDDLSYPPFLLAAIRHDDGRHGRARRREEEVERLCSEELARETHRGLTRAHRAGSRPSLVARVARVCRATAGPDGDPGGGGADGPPSLAACNARPTTATPRSNSATCSPTSATSPCRVLTRDTSVRVAASPLTAAFRSPPAPPAVTHAVSRRSSRPPLAAGQIRVWFDAIGSAVRPFVCERISMEGSR